VSRFHPTHLLTDRPATPVATLHLAREIGKAAGLHYVYTGNVPGDEGENTYCYHCRELVIERFGFSMQRRALRDGKCVKCGTPIEGVEIG